MRIRLMGVRGSVPVHGDDYREFGGATSSVMVKAGGEVFLLDAGSGLRGDAFAEFAEEKRFTMLLSHSHGDHLLGFPLFAPLFDPAVRGDVYLQTREGRDAKAQVEALMSPPLWPVTTEAIRGDIRFYDVPQRFLVGDVTVEALEVSHPGGCTAYKLTYGKNSLVYATDFEAGDREDGFAAFAKNCTLLLLDAQYTPEEYTRTAGFGHSTTERSLRLARQCGAKQTILIHHDPTRRDSVLRDWDEALRLRDPSVHFGREGEEVLL